MDGMHPSLQRFTRAVEQTLTSAGADEEVFLPRIAAHMRALLAHDDWLPAACALPDPQHYRQYLLYADPQDRFSVVSFVWWPGQGTPIHDHTVWGVIGMLRGAELMQGFTLGPADRPEGGPVQRLEPGAIGLVSPRIGDVHQVRNAHADRVSISIHAYGGNIGKIRRHVFAPDGGPRKQFVSGYSNAA